MGRARYGLRDVEGGLKYLEDAVSVNPAYYPAWQYMLQILSRHRRTEGPRWAQRAREAYPGCYFLALAVAGVRGEAGAVRELRGLLDEFGPTFTPEEMPRAAGAFSVAIMQLTGRFIGSLEVLDLLRRACEVFPQSARLADMLGHALHLAGKEEESRAVYARALATRRAALTYRSEFPKDEPRLPYWQFAEHIEKWIS
jgi:hypothetical protein